MSELEKAKKVKKPKLPERDVQTWLRLTSKNLYTRRQQADAKSNILLTINALTLSLTASAGYTTIVEHPHLLFAVVPLFASNLLSMWLAVSAVRPRLLAEGRAEDGAVEAHTASLVTFDDFYRMDQAEYYQAVTEVLQDQSLIYATLINDIHRLGIDLARRYRDLRRAYLVFVVGITSSVFLFGICYAAFYPYG